MLDLSIIQGLNPYYKEIHNLGVHKVSAAFNTGKYGEHVNLMSNDMSVQSNEKYIVPEQEKTDFEKYVGTIIDVAA